MKNPDPIILNADDVFLAAADFASKGKLQAQAAIIKNQRAACSYTDAFGNRCGVGAGMSKAQLAVLGTAGKLGNSIEDLLRDGDVKVVGSNGKSDTAGRERLRTLQHRHDNAADEVGVARLLGYIDGAIKRRGL